MQQIIGGNISFNSAEQILTLISAPTKPFPLQQAWQRQNNHKNLEAQTSAAKQPDSGPLITGTDNFQLPFVDLSGNYFYNKDSSDNKNAYWGGSLHSFGITGSWDSDIYYYDMSNTIPAAINIKTSKYSMDDDILGIFKKVELGDLYTTSSPVSGGILNGYGASLSNYDDTAVYEKQFNLRDVLPAGWEVELYRNGQLLGYRSSNSTGYYEFSDIQLYAGENKFTLIFYGPQGQVRRQERVLFYRGTILDKGRLGLRAYVVDKNKNLLDTGFKYPTYSTGLSALAEAAYGISENITLRVGAVQEPVSIFKQTEFIKTNKTFASAGLSLMLHPFYINIDSLIDFKEASASLDVLLQTSIQGFSINLENNYFNKNITTKNIYFNRLLKNTTNASLNKTFNISKSFSLPINFTYRYSLDTLDNAQQEFDFNIYQNLWFNIYAGIGYSHVDGFDDFNREFAKVYFSKFFRGNVLRIEGDYDLLFSKIAAINASYQFNISRNIDANINYSRNISSYQNASYINKYGAGINLKTNWGYFNVDGGYYDDYSAYISAGYSLSFGYDPQNKKFIHSPDKLFDTGMVAAGAFIDSNNNNTLDASEETINKAPFYVKPDRYIGDMQYLKTVTVTSHSLKKIHLLR